MWVYISLYVLYEEGLHALEVSIFPSGSICGPLLIRKIRIEQVSSWHNTSAFYLMSKISFSNN